MFGNLGFSEILLLMVIFLLVFGAKRLPEMGKSLGSGMRGFKDALTGRVDAQDEEAEKEQKQLSAAQPAPPQPAPPEPVAAQPQPDPRERDTVL